MKRPIAILGAGNMASALALNLSRHGRPVNLYSIEPEVEEEMRTARKNTKYLAGHTFPRHVTASRDLASVLDRADVVFVAVPSFAVAEVIEQARPFLSPNAIVASLAKGLDSKTLEPLILTEARLLPPRLRRRLCAIGGPAIATEMAKGSPTGLVVASQDKSAAAKIKRLLESRSVKVAASTDLKGVGLVSALKNPYAIALGMCDGLRLPTNAKALVITLALEELSCFLKKARMSQATAHGLAGLGDLVVTGFSPHGRNRTYGERLVGANSKQPDDLGLMTVEGIAATGLAVRLSKKLRVRAPLLLAVDRCLRARKDYVKPFMHYLTRLTLA